MALFPRKIDGRYAMIARQDNENLYLIYSDDLHRWDGGSRHPQAANIPGSSSRSATAARPIELDEGWLLLTHGVGPVRRYSIGAVLLDKADPSKVLARSREPLVRPEPSDREGYVPNVVYTCGGMRHKDRIILPYAVSDTFCSVATIKIAALIAISGDEASRGMTPSNLYPLAIRAHPINIGPGEPSLSRLFPQATSRHPTPSAKRGC